VVSSAADWDNRLWQLSEYTRTWGSADAPLGTDLGRWCAVQRRMYSEGRLGEDRMAALAALGFSWQSPSDVDDPMVRHDWDEMCQRFAVYRAEHGDGQVPKKFKPDPELGGWVAAVRRRGVALGAKRVRTLDALRFEWQSTSKCGSSFMKAFRELAAFRTAHGHTDVQVVLGAEHTLARWCDAQREAHRKHLLSPKRSAYLEGIGFKWERGAAD